MARTRPVPAASASTHTPIFTWHAVRAKRASAASANADLGGADNQQRDRGVVADLVGHRSEEEAAGARHAPVAHHEQVVVALLGLLHQHAGGLASDGHRGDVDAGIGVAVRLGLRDLAAAVLAVDA